VHLNSATRFHSAVLITEACTELYFISTFRNFPARSEVDRKYFSQTVTSPIIESRPSKTQVGIDEIFCFEDETCGPINMYIHVMHLARVAGEMVPESLRISDMDTASVSSHITGSRWSSASQQDREFLHKTDNRQNYPTSLGLSIESSSRHIRNLRTVRRISSDSEGRGFETR
jgi:hypothetical protein